MHYLLFYELGDDYLARRVQLRTEHLARAWHSSQRGELVLGGALANPVDGAVLLFKGDSPRVAEEFARADPYVTNGLVKNWYVREWTTVVGEQAATPVRPEGTAVANRKPVLRLWRGRSSAEKAADYADHVRQKVFPELRAIPGHRGASLLRRSVDSGIEFLVLTFWDSLDAIRMFAGAEKPETAVVEPAARAVLTDYEATAAHFELVCRSGEGSAP